MEHFFTDLGVVLVSTAALSALAVVFQQPIILAYIACGVIMGPWALGLVKNIHFIDNISHLGITLLLFLAGLNLHPRKLLGVLKKATFITFILSVFSFIVAACFAWAIGFNLMECLCVGLAMMFSSTILTIKLLPTTELHHARVGAACIGVLILQDLLAIAVLAFIRCLQVPEGAFTDFALLTGKLVIFIGVLALLERYVLFNVMNKVERLHELIFILGLAWCFGCAIVSDKMGLFHETGAFFAGVVVARHPISRFISESLKPIRDFFLVLFFFALGANINLSLLLPILLPALILSALFTVIKPKIIKWGFELMGERAAFSREVGIRLGQLSEFALLIAILALETGVVSEVAAQFIQVTTIMTFIMSSYYVTHNYQTPIGTREVMHRA